MCHSNYWVESPTFKNAILPYKITLLKADVKTNKMESNCKMDLKSFNT